MKKVTCIFYLIFCTLICNAQNIKGTWVSESAKKEAVLQKATTASLDVSAIEKKLPVKLVLTDSYCQAVFEDGSSIVGDGLFKDNILSIGLPDRIIEYEVKEKEENIVISEKGNSKNYLLLQKTEDK